MTSDKKQARMVLTTGLGIAASTSFGRHLIDRTFPVCAPKEETPPDLLEKRKSTAEQRREVRRQKRLKHWTGKIHNECP